MGWWDDFTGGIGDVFDNFGAAITDLVSGSVDTKGQATMTTPRQKLDHLTQIINEHERQWAALAQQQPTDLLRTFMVSRWDPFYREWILARTGLEPAGYIDVPEFLDALVGDYARKLSALRELAAANYIPTPDLGTAQHGVAGALTIQHTPSGQIVITHDPNGHAHAQPHVGAPHHGGGGGGGWHGHGGGGWHGGSRNFYMGGYDGWWPGYGYGYPLVQPVIQVPPGCYLDASGQVMCPVAQPAVAGWLDDIGNAVSNTVKGAVHGVTHAMSSAVGTVGHTLSQLKGPIATAAGLAAAAAASAIPVAGPLVAPMAAGLAHSLVDAAAGSGSVQAAAQQVVAQAATAAQQDPHVATALVAAQQAVTKAATGFHAAAQVARAAQGDARAAAQLAEMVNAAAAGDPQAIAAMNLTQGAIAATDATPGDSAQLSVSGALIVGADVRAQARAAAAQYPARVVGIVLRSDGTWAMQSFASSDDADDWYGGWLGMPHAYQYVGYFDGGAAQNESISRAYARTHPSEHTSVSGVVVPIVAALAGFAAGAFGPKGVAYAKAKWAEHKAQHPQAA